MELRSVFKRPFCIKIFLNSKSISYHWFGSCTKMKGIKVSAHSAELKFNLDNFILKKLKKLNVAIPYITSLTRKIDGHNRQIHLAIFPLKPIRARDFKHLHHL